METTDFASVLGITSGVSATVVVVCIGVGLTARFRQRMRDAGAGGDAAEAELRRRRRHHQLRRASGDDADAGGGLGVGVGVGVDGVDPAAAAGFKIDAYGDDVNPDVVPERKRELFFHQVFDDNNKKIWILILEEIRRNCDWKFQLWSSSKTKQTKGRHIFQIKMINVQVIFIRETFTLLWFD